MKKSIHLLILLAGIFIAACGEHNNDATTDAQPGVTSSAATEDASKNDLEDTNSPVDSLRVDYNGSTEMWHGRRIGQELIVGDMIFQYPKEESLLGVGTKIHLWPVVNDSIVVTYDFDTAVDAALQAKILSGIALWQRELPLKFVRRKTEDKVYVLYEKKTTGQSKSTIGRYDSVTSSKILSTTPIGSVAHEVGHTLGLFHEQNRFDRDTYVEVKGTCLNDDDYSKVIANSTSHDNPGTYNYESLMHYSTKVGCLEVKKSAIPVGTPVPSPGQRQRVTAGDVATIRSLYTLKEPSRI